MLRALHIRARGGGPRRASAQTNYTDGSELALDLHTISAGKDAACRSRGVAGGGLVPTPAWFGADVRFALARASQRGPSGVSNAGLPAGRTPPVLAIGRWSQRAGDDAVALCRAACSRGRSSSTEPTAGRFITSRRTKAGRLRVPGPRRAPRLSRRLAPLDDAAGASLFRLRPGSTCCSVCCSAALRTARSPASFTAI